MSVVMDELHSFRWSATINRLLRHMFSKMMFMTDSWWKYTLRESNVYNNFRNKSLQNSFIAINFWIKKFVFFLSNLVFRILERICCRDKSLTTNPNWLEALVISFVPFLLTAAERKSHSISFFFQFNFTDVVCKPFYTHQPPQR